jgi:hypothetical protein
MARHSTPKSIDKPFLHAHPSPAALACGKNGEPLTGWLELCLTAGFAKPVDWLTVFASH